jgi:integrase
VSVERVAAGWKVRYRDHSGKARSETLATKVEATKRDAEIKLAKKAREPIPLRGRGNGGETFKDFALETWWPKAVENRLAKATQEGYGAQLDNYLIPIIGDDALAFIDVERVLDVRAQLAAQKVKNYTAARTLKLLKQILGFAVQTGKLQHNPAAVLAERGQLPSQARVKQIRPLWPVETEAIRKALLARKGENNLRDATLISVLAYAGLRPSESLGLAWKHIGKDSIAVERAVKDGQLGATKTGETRIVPDLIKPLMADLGGWKAAAADSSPDALVFPNGNGAWSKAAYKSWKKRVFRPHAPDGADLYSFRHGYACLLRREGQDTTEIAERMGNSAAVNEQHYRSIFRSFRNEPPQPLEAVVLAARKAS